MGGAVGVVGVTWSVTRADGSAVSEDVLPVSGTLAFVSNSRQQTIRLSILPDTVPERTEVRRPLKYTYIGPLCRCRMYHLLNVQYLYGEIHTITAAKTYLLHICK